MSAKWIIAAGYLLAIPLSVFAGADKTAVATRTDTPPVVDGHLSDHCWDLAVPTTDFILLDPGRGRSGGQSDGRENPLHCGSAIHRPVYG